ncbi:hypothetical protein CABS01_05311 [Colletotrichum abscissum]|uniref:Uncharacterized protein n=1 Tax=Colletotrichum abscissum TaxID=1671311 RepID=A0A9P9X7F8_9PEZI|nr:uncharacterized protein CABS01_05311 [Colletotrichum abscissum]KAI3539821.1 hypothetical protein CABS02_11277 [Colletotrichum abscissum]KAK1523690.1 hypothetical protein CABS01_05311 [Colletotrichum abscissum]
MDAIASTSISRWLGCGTFAALQPWGPGRDLARAPRPDFHLLIWTSKFLISLAIATLQRGQAEIKRSRRGYVKKKIGERPCLSIPSFRSNGIPARHEIPHRLSSPTIQRRMTPSGRIFSPYDDDAAAKP